MIAAEISSEQEIKTLSPHDVEEYRRVGYHIERGVFNSQEIARLIEGFEYFVELAKRDNFPDYLKTTIHDVFVDFEKVEGDPDSMAYIRKVTWPSLIHPAFEEIRNSPKMTAMLTPLIGSDIKQATNNIQFKMPGSNSEFPWHQDNKPTTSFRDQLYNHVQMWICVDEATTENGCLYMVPGSHLHGDLEVKRYAKGEVEAKMDVSSAIPVVAKPGDIALFTPYTVHGSGPNLTDKPRRSCTHGFDRASSCDVGKWSFLKGMPVPITSNFDYHEVRAR